MGNNKSPSAQRGAVSRAQRELWTRLLARMTAYPSTSGELAEWAGVPAHRVRLLLWHFRAQCGPCGYRGRQWVWTSADRASPTRATRAQRSDTFVRCLDLLRLRPHTVRELALALDLGIAWIARILRRHRELVTPVGWQKNAVVWGVRHGG